MGAGGQGVPRLDPQSSFVAAAQGGGRGQLAELLGAPRLDPRSVFVAVAQGGGRGQLAELLN